MRKLESLNFCQTLLAGAVMAACSAQAGAQSYSEEQEGLLEDY